MHHKQNRPLVAASGAVDCKAIRSSNQHSAYYVGGKPRRAFPTATGRPPAEDGLPYGWWLCKDGRTVLFDRNYIPLADRLPSGETRKANIAEWVAWTTQDYFYDGPNARREPGLKQNLKNILADFLAGRAP